jgi:hypothetical protein
MQTWHLIVVPIAIACAVSASCGTSKNGTKPQTLMCTEDDRVNLTPASTRSDVCAQNGYTLIVRFMQPQTVEAFLPLLEPIGATLACDDPNALAGKPGKTCYIIRLKSNTCCSDGIAYFAGLSSPQTSTDVPNPETPCDCQTFWTVQ